MKNTIAVGREIPECFASLGLNPPVSIAEVKRAFRNLSRKHHPDVGGDAERFRNLHEQYEKAMALAVMVERKKAKRKARRGSGSIYRQPGTACWTIQYHVNGKRVRERTGTDDKQAAQQRLTQRLAAVDKGETIIPVRRKAILVEELYQGLEREYRRQRRRTLSDLQWRWNNHLKGFFGNMQATAVNKEQITNYCDKRLLEGAASASINREIAALKRAFYLAEEKLPRLPVFPEQLAESNPRPGFIEDEQFAKLTANVSVGELWLRSFLEISYCLGWRVSEIIGLRVKQIDLKHRTIRLEPGTTKTGEGREAPMNDRIYQLLQECCDGKEPDDFVLTRENKAPIRDFRRRWENLCKQAGLPALLVHDFRRSAARNLRRAGVAESVIMELAGWRTASVFRRYAIVAPGDKLSAIAKLDAQRDAQKAEAEGQNSHSFSHSQAKNDTTNADAQGAWKN